MKRVGWILLLVALNGCATHHVPKPSLPEPASTDWATVLALPRGTFVFVALEADDVRHGYVWEVTGDTLITCEIAGVPRCVRDAIARSDVARVTVRKQVDTKNRRRDAFIGIPIVSAFVGGLTGMIIGGVQKDRTLKTASALMFFGSLMASEALCVLSTLSSPKARFEDRIVYVRP
jgi:hypothetical protein